MAVRPQQRGVCIDGVFDTGCKIDVYSASDNLEEYVQLLNRADKMFSAENDYGEIYKLNQSGFAELSEETTALLCDTVVYTNRLGEYFDITLKPVCDAWDIKNNNGMIPQNIKETLSLKGIENIEVDIDNNTARINKQGAGVTLGAAAKGYATDMLVDAMRRNGERSALINLGGNIYALGKKKDKSDWTIGIMNPKQPGESAAAVSVSDCAVVTSGDYERYFELDGKRYHHIIDPTDGYPAESGLHSVTVIGKKAELCDILSTAMFVAGLDSAAQLAREYEVDAVMIDDNTVYYTPGLDGRLTLIDNTYEFAVLN